MWRAACCAPGDCPTTNGRTSGRFDLLGLDDERTQRLLMRNGILACQPMRLIFLQHAGAPAGMLLLGTAQILKQF